MASSIQPHYKNVFFYQNLLKREMHFKTFKKAFPIDYIYNSTNSWNMLIKSFAYRPIHKKYSQKFCAKHGDTDSLIRYNF